MNQHIDFNWIDTNEKLIIACRDCKHASVVALDTEFVRIRSFFPKLGLLQLFDGKKVYLIDPLTISDFTPFIELLKNPNILKVLHACGEDLEVFQHYFNQLPEPMIDTQVIGKFIGLGISVGFSKLVDHYYQIKLDKSSSRTDWLARPLNEKQLQYAAADVRYLLPIYQKMQVSLIQTCWQKAVEEECHYLKAKKLIEFDVDKAYKKIGNAWQLNSQQLSVLQLLESWRYKEAQKRDLALNFVVKEQSLLQIAKLQPKHTACLLEFMHPNEVRLHGKKLLLLVEQAKNIAAENYPEPIHRLIDAPHYKRDMHFLKKVVQECQPQDLPTEVFASKRQLEQLFKWQMQGQPQDQKPELLFGWRSEFGNRLLEKYRIFLQTSQ